jgi:regulator of RNase E activity RraA
MTNDELIARVRQCRLSDLCDAMDAIGLVNIGTMSSEMRPFRAGISMAGFAYTLRFIPTQKPVQPCKTFEEYMKVLGEYCWENFRFFNDGITHETAKDMVVVADMGGYPAGLFGSENGLGTMKKGVVGVVVDGGLRDSAECLLEQVKAWCTKRTFNHLYGRLENGGVNIPIECAGVKVNPGDVDCGDDDGVLVIPRERAEEVVDFAEKIRHADQEMRAEHYRDLGLAHDETLGDVQL